MGAKDRHEAFYNEEKCKDKDLIWHMVGEMNKKLGWAKLFISCSYSYTFYFLVKILLVKLKNLHTSACLKLNYCTAKHKNQNCKGAKMVEFIKTCDKYPC